MGLLYPCILPNRMIAGAYCDMNVNQDDGGIRDGKSGAVLELLRLKMINTLFCVNFYTESDFFPIDIPIRGKTVHAVRMDFLRQYIVRNLLCMCSEKGGYFFIALTIDGNMIGDVEIRFFSHGLDFADNFTDKALFHQFVGKFGIQYHSYAAVAQGGEPAVLPLSGRRLHPADAEQYSRFAEVPP